MVAGGPVLGAQAQRRDRRCSSHLLNEQQHGMRSRNTSGCPSAYRFRHTPAYVPRFKKLPAPAFPRNLSFSTSTRPWDITTSGIPFTLVPSNIE